MGSSDGGLGRISAGVAGVSGDASAAVQKGHARLADRGAGAPALFFHLRHGVVGPVGLDDRGGSARAYVEIWAAADWQRWLANIVVPLALWLAIMGIGIGYPHTLGGRRAQVFDVNNPGMAAVTRHPVLWALALWSLVHMLANGDLAHVILFGGFLIMALLAMPVFDRRAQRVLSDAQWAEVRRVAPLLPHPAFSHLNRRNLAWRSATAVVIYLIAYQLHQPVIGVSPEIF